MKITTACVQVLLCGAAAQVMLRLHTYGMAVG
jgi:hypothetical protein